MSKVNPDDLPYRPCVGIMLLNRQNRVWMGHRPLVQNDEYPPSSPRWQMPQGGIDDGEEAKAAAIRELWEETGVTTASLIGRTTDWLTYDLPEELIGKALKGRWRGQKQLWFLFRFEGDDSEINISDPPDGAPVEFDQWEWVDFEEVTERIVEFKREVYRAVTREFKSLVRS